MIKSKFAAIGLLVLSILGLTPNFGRAADTSSFFYESTPQGTNMRRVILHSDGTYSPDTRSVQPKVKTTAAASNLVVKATPGWLLSLTVTTGATAGYVMIFNATSAPADGAVTPDECFSVPATTTLSGPWGTLVDYSTGITVVFSSTGCFTKTASATAFISAQVQ